MQSLQESKIIKKNKKKQDQTTLLEKSKLVTIKALISKTLTKVVSVNNALWEYNKIVCYENVIK